MNKCQYCKNRIKSLYKKEDGIVVCFSCECMIEQFNAVFIAFLYGKQSEASKKYWIGPLVKKFDELRKLNN